MATAKKTEETSTKTEEASTTSVVPAQVVFRDKAFTSRKLILPKGRVVPVAGGRVIADSDDKDLQEFLTQNADFEREE